MQPVLWPGDRLLVAPAATRRLARGDLVLAADPRDPARVTVKRVVGLPGEHVSLDAGELVIDGRAHDERYATATGAATGTWRLTDDEVLLLGDNRDGSTDARVLGPTPRGEVRAVAVARVWPPRLGLREAAQRRAG